MAKLEWRTVPSINEQTSQLQQLLILRQRTNLENRPNKWSWVPADDGSFLVTSTRAILNRFAVPYYPYEWIKRVPKKINIFGW
ncbi:hypothetical protein HanRHA438_Chr11g0519871 [Helianthus annuus]|nr:hypothetical protein HanRHA438_Chr11g0519871 [Helianthus annuus]